MEDRLRKFGRLVEKGSFTAAAEDLHISQPALTLAINKLERELKAALLVRGRHRLELTDAGRIVYKTAVELRTMRQNLRTKLVELADERPKTTIGMIDSVAAALNAATEPLDELEAEADVSIIVNNSRYLRSAVENREIDLAFVVHDPASHPALDVVPAGSEPFALVCRPDRLGAFQAALETGKLPDFISYDRHSTTYGHLRRGLHELKISTRPILYSTSPGIMLNMVMRGRGAAALPRLLAKDLLEANELVALERDGLPLSIGCPLSMVKLRGKLLPKPLEIFSDAARTVLAR